MPNEPGRPPRRPGLMRRLVVLLAAVAMLGACDTQPAEDSGTILIVAMSGPTCPVETDPPDPDCAPRPVAGAPITLVEVGGSAFAEGETGADGRLTLVVPAGDYVVTAGPVEGLMAAPDAATVAVLAGLTIEVPLGYDTGIR
jgi:hypothetical protein